MTVWANLQRHTSQCWTRIYFDDSTSVCDYTQEVVDLLGADRLFDRLSGQLISEVKSVAITNTPQLQIELGSIVLSKNTLQTKPAAKLVCAGISCAAGTDTFLLDQHIQAAVGYLQRIEHLPFSLAEMVTAIDMQPLPK